MAATVAAGEVPPSNHRREERLVIASLVFPFLGSRELDHAFFQYLPIDISPAGLQLIIPKWVVNRERLRIGDRINLHVPFRIDDEVYSEGVVAWTRWDEEDGGQRCGVAMDRKVQAHYPIFIELGTNPGIGLNLQDFNTADSLLLQLFKDAILLKRGVRIYLKHLVAYFSRLAEVASEEYRQLKTFLFVDLDNRIVANQGKLEALAEVVRGRANIVKELARYVDLEELRQMMESEIYIEILRAALSTEAVLPLLQAIKSLEKKQYANYNAIVMLYVQSLQ